jgi:acyl-CoA reductase-like NAD-dependent aldehyde dehydrogenase
VVNPSNPSEILGTTPKSDRAETERAIEAAAEALPGWKAMLPASRGASLWRPRALSRGARTSSPL